MSREITTLVVSADRPLRAREVTNALGRKAPSRSQVEAIRRACRNPAVTGRFSRRLLYFAAVRQHSHEAGELLATPTITQCSVTGMMLWVFIAMALVLGNVSMWLSLRSRRQQQSVVR
ncbi:hypothetical protein [Streptomyces halobius]|uniref:Uncharacterized protein n=1 Tax=Streptomyces halobius TaxID=2879846 RepID=A0ABY4MAU1_9ACTN|nr:hypothetical protein [Streptomyces halobius]UQA94899.1 hypothetical protein K9S39_26315 [Streptomyces halobius]